MGTHFLQKVVGTAVPHFSAHVLWRNGWMDQDALGTEVGLGPGHIALDETQLPLPAKNVVQPLQIFGPSLLWPSGWIDQDATWYEGRPRPRPDCVRWGPTPPNGHSPQFLARVYCGKRSSSSARPTAEHL